MPSPDQPSIELRLPEKPPEPRELSLSVQEVQRLLQGGSLAGQLLESQESRPPHKEGEPRERTPKTQQPSVMEVEQRAVEMEQQLFRSIVDRTNVSLRTAMELAESRAAMQRMQAWGEVQAEDQFSLTRQATTERLLLPATVELDRVRTLIQYQEALIHDFLNVVDRYVAYVQKPEGAALRQELLRKDGTHAEKEKKVAAMLEELKQILPLLGRLTQVRYYETMLEEDEIATTISGLNAAELATKLDALRLPAKTGETETQNLSLSELVTKHPDNRELFALHRALPPVLQKQSLGKLHVILHNPGDYRTLEKQVNNPDLTRRIAGGGTLREGMETHVRNLRGEIAKGSRRFALQIPGQTPQGANAMEQRALDLLNKGVAADASEEELRSYSDVLEKRMRDMFRVGEPWEMANERRGERESRVANSLYLGTLMERREQLFRSLMERKEGELPNLAKLAELHDLYMQEIAETVAYHKEELTLAGDILSLLYTQRHIGPGTRPTEIPRFINRLNARERAALERTIGAPLMKELEDEGQIYSRGLDEYITAIEKACDRHNTFWKNFKEKMVQGLDAWSQKLEELLVGLHGIAWYIPDRTGFGDYNFGNLVRHVVDKAAGEGYVIDTERLKELIGEWKGEIQSMKRTIKAFESGSEMERGAVRTDTKLLRQLHMGIPSNELALAARELNPAQVGSIVMSETFSFIPAELREKYQKAKQAYEGEMEKSRQGADNRNQLSEAMARYQSINEQVINLYFNNYYLSLAENPKSGVPNASKEQYKTVRQGLLSAKADPEKLKEATEKLRKIECEMMEEYIRSVIQNYTEAKQAAEAAKGTPQEEQVQAKLYVWKQRAATAYLRILEDLQVHDLPGLTGEVEKLMNSLGEKVGKHVERFRQLQIMESAAWSTGIGAITTIAEPFVLYGGLRTAGLIRGPLGAPARWGARMMGRGGRALLPREMTLGRAGGTALLAYRTYLDWQEIGEIQKSIAEQRQEMIKEMRDAGFVADPPNQEEKYTYKDGGTEITVNIKNLEEAQEEKVTAQELRTAVSAAETLAVLRFGVSRTFWPIMAVEVAVETVKYGMDQEADRRFVLRAPAWLLAKISLEKATGESAYDLLAKASGEMMTDSPFNDAEDSKENREKREMRGKMLFAILHTELREFPELLQMVYGGNEHPKFLDAFYGKEFKEIFLPVFYSRLFELSGNGLSWEEISRGQIDSDWHVPLPTSPKITKVEIRRAMRESIVFLTQHRTEETYLAAVRERGRLPNEVSDARRLQVRMDELNDLIQKLGEMEVFGKKLNEAGSAVLERNGGKTRAQLIAGYLFSRAQDIQFSVPANEIHGLPEGFSFGARGAICRRYLKDTGLQNEMNRVFPETTDEPEGRVYDPILQNMFTVDHWLPSVDRDRRANSAHNARYGANCISAEAGMPELRWNASEDASRQRMTAAAIELVQKDRDRASRLRRNTGLESMYIHDSNTPVVFTRYHIPEGRGMIGNDFPRMERLIHELRYPPKLDGEQFSFDNVAAVFFEARILGGGQAMVLATYVYGDPESGAEPPEFFVLQQSRVVAIAHGESYMEGHYKVLGGRSFLQQQQAREMVASLSGPLEARRQSIIEQRRKKHEEEKKLGEKRAEMLESQELARQTAKRNPGMWHAYPHDYLDSHKGERMHEHVAYYRPSGAESGYFLYLRKPVVLTGLVVDSADKTYKKTVGNSSTTRIEVVDERTGANYYFNRMGGWYLNYLQEQKTSIPKEVFTEGLCMPIPENPLASVRNVIALFVGNIDDREHRESERILLEQYEKLKTNAERREFLRRLEFTARKLAGDGKNTITKVGFEMLLVQYGALYTAPLDRRQWKLFVRGHELCGQPDENGIYTVEKTKGLSPLSVYTRFIPDQGKWEWSSDREHWFAPSLVNVWHTDGNYYSPSSNAIGILRQLEI